MPRQAAAGQAGTPPAREAGPDAPGHHVRPGDGIQEALEEAARDPATRRCSSMPGLSAPGEGSGPDLVQRAARWHHARGRRRVVLTAANPQIADSGAPSPPAVVNHVVYFGDGISPKTVLRGFRITGANNFTTGSGERSPIESDDVRKTLFFYSDGGGIKIYARSYPTIEQVEVYGNYTSPCGGGVSVEHLDRCRRRPVPRLHLPQQPHPDDRLGGGSPARQPRHARELPVRRQHRQPGRRLRRPAQRWRIPSAERLGALTVFERSRATVSRARSPVTGTASTTAARQHLCQLIFWKNTLPGGISPGQALRDRHRRRRRRERVVHQRRRQRSARDDRSSREHVRRSGSALRREFVPAAPVLCESGAIGRCPESPRLFRFLDVEGRVDLDWRGHRLLPAVRPRDFDAVDALRRPEAEIQRVDAV